MLIGAPKILFGKYKYENGLPVAICELTEEEQEAFDEFYKVVKTEMEHRFTDIKW